MKTTDPSLDIVRQFFLEENPNPERIGCPPEETLKAAAEDRLSVNDPARLHLADCSECFAEYRGYRLEWENKRTTQRRVVGWAIAAGLLIAAGVGAIAVRHHLGPKQGPEQIAINTPPPGGKATSGPIGGEKLKQENPPVITPAPEGEPEGPKNPKRVLPPDRDRLSQPDQSVHTVLDLSLGDPAQRQRQLRLRAAELNLSLLLPLSSGPGSYQVNLTQDAAGEKVLASTAGDAVTRNGRVSLKVHFPLQSIAPGGYFLSVAQRGNAAQNNAVQNSPVQNSPGQNNAGRNNATQGQGVYDVQVVRR